MVFFFHKECKIWVYLANFGYFDANLRPFWYSFTGLNSAVVYQNWRVQVHPWAIRFFHLIRYWYDICFFSLDRYDTISMRYFGLRNDLFRCASISWFQVVSKWFCDVFTASASFRFIFLGIYCLTTFFLGEFFDNPFLGIFWWIVPKRGGGSWGS